MTVRLLIVLASCLFFVNCVSEAPSLRGSLEVSEANRATLVAEIDQVVSRFGLVRLEAPGIATVTSEGTVFYAYGRMGGDRKRPLVIHNLKAKDRVAFEIYEGDFDDQSERAKFVEQVTTVFQRFGTVTYANE